MFFELDGHGCIVWFLSRTGIETASSQKLHIEFRYISSNKNDRLMRRTFLLCIWDRIRSLYRNSLGIEPCFQNGPWHDELKRCLHRWHRGEVSLCLWISWLSGQCIRFWTRRPRLDSKFACRFMQCPFRGLPIEYQLYGANHIPRPSHWLSDVIYVKQNDPVSHLHPDWIREVLFCIRAWYPQRRITVWVSQMVERVMFIC